MTGFKTDLFKASVLAVMTAILLGAATYVLSAQIEMAPRPVATVDAYTKKGGYGPGIVSSFYLYNENVSIFATVKDATNKPIAHTTVAFEIHGPPSSNITLPTQTSTTNSSGVAVANITAPNLIGQPKTVLGIWTAVAITEVSGTQIVDSLAFEVKAPPTPFVDVYTDRGGKGTNMPSQAYNLNNTVYLYAEASNGTDPVVKWPVFFAVYAPGKSAINQTLTFVQTSNSNESGIAISNFRIPQVPEISVGTWQVIVTVGIYSQVFIDALTFQCLPL